MKKNLLIIILLLFTSTWSIGQEAPDKSGPKEIVKTLKASNLSDIQARQFVESPPTGETFYEGFEGDVFPPAGWPASCSVNNSSSNDYEYGRLYNWYAVNDGRKLCPNGWKVPTHEDWAALADLLGGESVAGL